MLYNKINGTYSSENGRLLNDILRDEWGFDGLVMSDWGAVCDRPRGVEAGLDLEATFGFAKDYLLVMMIGLIPFTFANA